MGITLTADCPRCGILRCAFDVLGMIPDHNMSEREKRDLELYSVCRHCYKPSLLVANCVYANIRESFASWEKTVAAFKSSSLDPYLKVSGFVSLIDMKRRPIPEFLPQEIESLFAEATACLSIECWNASAVMFRTALDLATRTKLPLESQDGLTSRVRRDLGLRLPWLFEHSILPDDLKKLSDCIREEGNDGAHQGNLGKSDAEDVYDFAFELLKRLFTEPRKIELAEARRLERRS